MEATYDFCTFRAFLNAIVRNAVSIVESRRSIAALITWLNVPVSWGTVCQATPVRVHASSQKIGNVKHSMSSKREVCNVLKHFQHGTKINYKKINL
jgi:hypothetical protein